MATPREHIEEIRRKKFSIGGEPNPLTEDLHHAVKNLSAELYAKDVHFLMELIQNAEDNEYLAGANPSLEFIITSKDITAMGASATLLIFNNEKGFSNRNIDSICSVGRSTKKGKRQNGYIGEKGIGFKSVFLVTSQPYIFSNGYQIRFNEEPNQDCQIGYVVPEWVDENPTLADIQQIYGSTKILPTTTIILPLKSEKVAAVKQQLSSLHPEVLLFLSKIKRLSVKEENADPQLNTVSAISISSEMDLKTRKNIDAESYTLHLSAEENEDKEKECSYYMWKQKFPVALRSRVGRRMEIEEWAITLAFPFGERLDRNLVSSPGIYMFLPTEMVTNFPFIIQADFVLASSRETILLDNEWNKGILECVPSAFINAFVSLVKTVEAAPASSLPQLFKFLPVKNSLYPELNTAREKIREKVITEHIVPCESSTEQKILCRPHEACRLLPDFWNVLNKAMSSGLSVHSLSSHGACILNSAFDKAEFDEILSFLEVPYVNDDWYAKCIQSSNLVLGVPEYVYVRLLCFLVYNWNHCFIDIPILKYVDQDGKVDSRSLRRASLRSDRICLSSEVDQIPWLIKWSKEFRCAVDTFFMPESTQKALRSLSNWEIIRNWLKKYACVKEMTVYSYGILLVNALNETRPLIAFNPFLYHSFYRNYLSESEVSRLCNSMPVIDNYGVVKKVRTGILVPATVSKWMELMGSNPWRGEKLVELSSKYVSPGNFGDICINGDQLMSFLKTYMKALDIPEICPPNAAFQTASSPLTKKNAFLLLDWIRNLKYKGISFPEKFLRCIREGSWLKTRLGYKPPSESFLSSLEWGNLVQMGSVLVDIPLIDEKFYDDNISSYKEELKMMGVMVEPGEACAYIAKRLMSLAASSRLTRENVFSVLRLINFLRETYLSPKEFIDSVKDGKWLKTSLGERSPAESVLFDSEWEAVSKISQLPFIDEKYYGKEIHNYRSELQLLGVEVGFDQNYLLVADNLKLPAVLATLTRDSVLLILGCIRSTSASEHLVRTLKDQSWLKTNLGFKVPAESFLFDPQWGCLLQIVDGIPLIDENFYGSSSLRSYKDELKQVGVVVNFEEASKAVSHRFKQASSSMTLKRENVLSLLECYKHLKAVNLPLPRELVACIHEQKWLKTHLGYKSPHESILFDSEWESISPIASLPFIDDTHYGKIIYTYRDEIEALGVVVKFKQGVRFVAAGLNLPANPVEIALGSALSLLECIKILREEGSSSLSEELVKSVDKEWLKTHMGYRSPKECLLFDSNWGSFLQQEDGPFIDEAFYGDRISSYRDELRAMGVVVDTKDWCPLLANHLEYHSQLPVITRIYEYLSNFNWQPEDKSNCWIWIPNGSSEGEWVSPDECALHDKDNLFSLQLDVLEKYYDKKLLSFFSSAFKVAHSPTTEDYCELWKDWEIGQHQVTEKECCSFWEYITKHWNSRTENHLMSGMSKLPVNTVSGEIQLSHKQEVFIPDDLFLKDLFGKAFPEPIFVWYPQPSLPSLSLSKLYDIYKSIGVRTISESIRKNEFSAPSNVELRKIKRSNGLIGEGLLRIILAYLADPCFEMPVDRRHRIIQSLLDLTVFIMVEPVAWSYCLPLSSGKTLSVKASKMVRWERNSSKLLVHNFNKKNHKAKIEFATCFSESISEGLLWENTDRIADLCELIKLGCLLQFEVDAVKFLLKTKKLQLFVEDEEFLSSAFPSDQGEPKPVIE